MTSKSSSTYGKINIAIDGPAGAGKSTVARRVANLLSYVYVDTGAMYRAATWYLQGQGIGPDEEEIINQIVPKLVIELIPTEKGQLVMVNGHDVTVQIRSIAVSNIVSRYSQIEGLRHRLTALQREMAVRKGVVMDGRDIGTTVLPDAEVKIYLTATVKERALRRYKELKEQDKITLEQLEHDIANRDRLDQEREISPLRRAEDAALVDTTHMSTDEVVQTILSICRANGSEREQK